MVRISLPGTQHAKQAELHVESEKLTLTVAGKYRLQLPLPHRVAAAEGAASFNSGKQKLEVVLPVLPSASSAGALRPTPLQQQAEVETQSEDRGGNNAHDPSDSMPESESTATSSACAAPPPAEAAANNEQLSGVGGSQQNMGQDRDAVPQQASDGLTTEPLTANQRKWQELHPRASSSTNNGMQAEASHATATADTDPLRAAAVAGRHLICTVTASCCVHSFTNSSELLDLIHTDCCTERLVCVAQARSFCVASSCSTLGSGHPSHFCMLSPDSCRGDVHSIGHFWWAATRLCLHQ